MFMTRAKIVTVVLLTAGLTALGGGLLLRGGAAGEASAEAPAPAAPRPADEKPPPPAPAPARGGELPPLLVTRKSEVKLDFEVAKVGRSGLGAVDVYVTTDEGKTWGRVSSEGRLRLSPPPAPPAAAAGNPSSPASGSVTVRLPKEGVVYGFSLVVKSGAGWGKPPPAPGDLPQMRVESDRTPPQVQLYSPRPAPGRPDSLVLTWQASDRNLAPRPVVLEWAPTAEGPWALIGDGRLPNTGKYTWAPSDKVPAKVYLRLTARDTAGNVAVAQTAEPVLVDMSVPEATIKGAG